jgi:hypothetical protein
VARAPGGAASTLAHGLGEPREPTSSSENVLLAVPYLEDRPGSGREIEQIVRSYTTAVETAAVAGYDVGLLVALAEYGRRWEVIVETQLSVREPSTITLVEDRPLDLRGGWSHQHVALNDARTFHAQFHVIDHAVEIASFRVTDLEANPSVYRRSRACGRRGSRLRCTAPIPSAPTTPRWR